MNRKISLDQFITNYSCVDLSLARHQIKIIVDWLFKNQSRLVFVFDGLDQMNKTVDLEKLSQKTITPDAKVNSFHWLASILSRKILTQAKIIVTSRPYALTCLSGDCRPEKSYKLDGFSEDDFMKVLRFYIDDETIQGQIFSAIKQYELEKTVSSPISMYLITKMIFNDQINLSTLTSFGLLTIVFEKFYTTKNAHLDETGKNKPLIGFSCRDNYIAKEIFCNCAGRDRC